MSLADDEPRVWAREHRRMMKFAGLAGVRPLATSLIFVVAVIAAYLDQAYVAVGAVLVGIATIMWAWRPALRLAPAHSDHRLVAVTGSAAGTFLIPRMLLITVGFAGVSGQVPVEYMVTGLLLVVAVALELSLRSIAERIVPMAANLPGFTYYPQLFYSPSLVALVWLGAGCVHAASMYRPDFLSGSLVLAIISVTLTAVLLVQAASLVLQRNREIPNLRRALEEYSPVVLFHWEAPPETTYQVGMWLPYVEKLGVPFAVLLRSPANFLEVAALTDRPIIFRERLSELDTVIVPSLRAVLYCNTATVNNHVVRYTHLKHIQLNHGDSDKAPSYNPAFKMFTRNFVAGQAAVDRFTEHGIATPPDFFRIVGRPQITTIAVGARAEGAQRTVLYAPTWQGFYSDANYSSLPLGLDIVRFFAERGVRVVFRAHPYSQLHPRYAQYRTAIIDFLRQHSAQSGVKHVWGDEAELVPLAQVFNRVDALISDVSSVAADFLYSEKPLAMVRMSNADAFSAQTSLARCAYVLPGREMVVDPKTRTAALEVLFDQLFTHDPLAAARVAMKRHYLGDIPDDAREQFFVETLRDEVLNPVRS
ncbi:CDP-glycerol glycerophosphotransferase family protein [Jonesia quinghaiensis]|uniref:CDP-glycerol glycerophosphotransferase family protein n=1 Tax=Jonesia quinghaiensis TaxID=262806 RepID=UPI0003F88BC6|nr:CDP-glycerol glycerophosphotransferase family protein [Jonesia quinghaiensis]